jgi:ClpP class serine protease
MIALAADEIVMDENAVLGPVDPQIGSYPAASILKVLAEKKINRIDDQTLILADIAAKAQRQIEDTVYRLLGKHLPEEEARKHARLLSGGHWTHDFPLTTQTLQEFGLPVSTEMPLEIYNLMALYPQPGQRRPSVQYTPLPTGNEEGRGKPGE